MLCILHFLFQLCAQAYLQDFSTQDKVITYFILCFKLIKLMMMIMMVMTMMGTMVMRINYFVLYWTRIVNEIYK